MAKDKQDQNKIKIQEDKKEIGSSKIPLGEYQLHVFIQETMNLFTGDNEETVDAIIQVKAFGDKQYTQIKNNIGYQEIFWGQHIFFEKQFTVNHINQSHVVLQKSTVLISVFDHNKFLSDNLIGSYQIDITRIYLNQKRSMEHVWLALSNTQQQYSQIKGYIKVCISCTGINDKPTIFAKQDIKKNNKLDVVLPPHIQRKMFNIKIYVIKAEDIKQVDFIGSVDPYVVEQFGNQSAKTDHKSNNQSPMFNQLLQVPFSLPNVSQRLIIKVFDHNAIGSNQLIGSVYFQLAKLQKLKKIKPCWYHIYGPQNGGKSQMKEFYAQYSSLATFYCGSILLGFQLDDSEVPRAKSSKIPQNWLKENVKISIKDNSIRLVLKLYAVTNTPKSHEKYTIMARFGEKQFITKQVKSNNGYCQFNTQIGGILKYHHDGQIPELFIYLVQDKDKICYLRCQLNQPKAFSQAKFRQLIPDKAISDLNDQRGGWIKFSLQVQKSFTDTKDIKKQFSTQSIYNSGKATLIINFYQARNLTPKDDNGASDPYFKIKHLQTQIKSFTIKNTLNPVYRNILTIPTIATKPQKYPPIFFQCIDQDIINDEYIGSTFIEVSKGISQGYIWHQSTDKNGKSKLKPKWIHLKQSNRNLGQILISCEIVQKNVNIPSQMNIICSKFRLKIKALGMRGLRSAGILTIRHPYLIF